MTQNDSPGGLPAGRGRSHREGLPDEEFVAHDRRWRRPKVAYQWPVWICGALDARKADVCGLEATWMKLPTRAARTPRLYCEQHRPLGATRIPPDAAFHVTRLELRVAVSGAPGDHQASADEAVRRIQCGVEAVGGVIVGLRVLGLVASTAGASSPPLRLQLARELTIPPADVPLWEAPYEYIQIPTWRRRRRRG